MMLRKILYVIGEVVSSLHCKRALEKDGYSVVCVTNDRLACEMLQKRSVDLVLLDAQHQLEGAALSFKHIRPQTPIVILSSQELMNKGIYAWADAFVNNVDCTAILAAVKSVLAA